MGKSYDEVWAVAAERVEAFFRELGGEVEIISLPEREVGPLTVPQTRIIITGDDAEELYRQFFLRFVSAGG